jgi:hypothetical protein
LVLILNMSGRGKGGKGLGKGGAKRHIIVRSFGITSMVSPKGRIEILSLLLANYCVYMLSHITNIDQKNILF